MEGKCVVEENGIIKNFMIRKSKGKTYKHKTYKHNIREEFYDKKVQRFLLTKKYAPLFIHHRVSTVVEEDFCTYSQ